MPFINGDTPKIQKRVARVLNVLERRYDTKFYQAIASVMVLRDLYLQDRFIFVRGDDMIPILKGLGARSDDFEYAQQFSDLTGPDPTLDYRTVTYGRYCVDTETRCIRRLEEQPYTLTEQEDYKRHDSGQQRMFEGAPPDMQGNTVVQALLLFKSLIYNGVSITPRDRLDYYSSSWICNVFNARTHTAKKEGIYGEPALEGVHSDGSDHTMTVFLGSHNMRADSAVTFMHDNGETTGTPVWDTNPMLIRARVHHQHFLDTLVFVDHEFKHSVTSVYQENPARPTTRDMLVVFTRRPKMDGHVSGYADSMELHADAPLHLPMWLP